MHRVRMILWKELLELRLNPRLFGLVILAPLVQLTMLGYAATTDVKNVPLVVADGDRSARSRELVQRFDASRNFAVVRTMTTVAEIEPYLRNGRAWIALSIPPGYGEEVAAGRPVTVQVVADGSDANSTTVAMGYATSLVGAYAQELAAAAAPAAAVSLPGIDPRVRVWFNPQVESRHFMIPGVLALVLLIVTANLSSMAIVREKEVGTLEQLNVTPLGRWELIVGKLLPYGIIGLLDVLLVIAVAVLWFEVPLRGSLVLLLAVTLVYVLCTLALGLFVSTVAATQQQAMMITVLFFLMPMVYLSGFIFPIENMPAAVQTFTYLIPLRYFLVMVRGIFLKGIGIDLLWPQALALTAWGLVVLALAVARSRKRMA